MSDDPMVNRIAEMLKRFFREPDDRAAPRYAAEIIGVIEARPERTSRQPVTPIGQGAQSRMGGSFKADESR